MTDDVFAFASCWGGLGDGLICKSVAVLGFLETAE